MIGKSSSQYEFFHTCFFIFEVRVCNSNSLQWVLKFCNSKFPAYHADLGLQSIASKFLKSDFLTQDLKKEVQEVFDESSSSSSSSESESGSDSDDSSSDSEDLSIPKKSKKDAKPTK